MFHTSKQRFTRMAAVAALCISSFSANAAFKVTEGVDGTWFKGGAANEAIGRQGMVLDFFPANLASGAVGVLSVAVFTYDQNSQLYWAGASTEVFENEFEFNDMVLERSNGPQFFAVGPGGANTRVGTLSLSFNTCNSANLTIRPDASTGLPTRTINGIGPSLVKNAQQCVYQRSFTACPSFSTTVAAQPRTCQLTGQLAGNVNLTNETTWVLSGLVRVGGDNTAPGQLRVEAGTRVQGAGATADYLYVNPGSQIFVDGTAYAPVVFTSPKDGVRGQRPAPKDWGGLVISGNAPTNCGGRCASEFDPTLRFGGGNATESSGTLRYFQVRYSGFVFQPNREVNSLTLQGVGSGTTIEFFQSYRGGDDGVEMFGGTVNLKRIVLNEGGDDGIDWDLGWSGKIQYALVSFGQGFGEDFGIEAANSPDNLDALPRAIPVLANVTLLGNHAGSGSTRDAIQFKDGSGGRIFNTVGSGFNRACLEIRDNPTFNHAGTPAAPTGSLGLFGTVLGNCPTIFRTTPTSGQTAPFTTNALFEIAGNGNSVNNMLGLVNGYLPGAGSVLSNGGYRINGVAVQIDPFFDVTNYVGAFRDANDDWTRGWTFGF